MNNATIAASQKTQASLAHQVYLMRLKVKMLTNISNTFSGHIQKPSTSKNNYNDNNLKSISVSVESTQNVVNGKGISTVKAIANDATTGKKPENATIKLRINFTSNGTSKLIVGHNGVAIYSVNLNLKPNYHDDLGFTASAQASAPGTFLYPRQQILLLSLHQYLEVHLVDKNLLSIVVVLQILPNLY